MKGHFGCGVQRNAGSQIWTAEIAAAAAEGSGFEWLISLSILNLFFSLEAFYVLIELSFAIHLRITRALSQSEKERS